MSNAAFPALASFGPLFIAAGFLVPTYPYGCFVAFPGALMTSAALLIVFRQVVTARQQSEEG